jgi:hypothetical protein
MKTNLDGRFSNRPEKKSPWFAMAEEVFIVDLERCWVGGNIFAEKLGAWISVMNVTRALPRELFLLQSQAIYKCNFKSANLQVQFTTAIYKLRSTTGQMPALVNSKSWHVSDVASRVRVATLLRLSDCFTYVFGSRSRVNERFGSIRKGMLTCCSNVAFAVFANICCFCCVSSVKKSSMYVCKALNIVVTASTPAQRKYSLILSKR